MLDPRSPYDRLLYPHECFTALRESTHVQYDPKTLVWDVTDYDLVRHILTEHEIFSSDETRVRTLENDAIVRNIVTTDPPEHQQVRSLVTQAFTPKAIAQLTPRIEASTHDLLDTVAAQGKMDVIQDLSSLPVTVITEMLGLPMDDCPRLKSWSDDVLVGEHEDLVGESREEVARKVRQRFRHVAEEMNDYFKQAIAQRRKKPTNDLINALLEAQVDGEFMPEEALLSLCQLLATGGNNTTTTLIGNAILCFDEHPEVMARLRERPELIPQAIEEVLRYRSPTLVSIRTLLSDVELGGQLLKRGEKVFCWLPCANHDPSQFPHPERFDIERNPNRHLTLGHGIHFCLGASLARLETKIVLTIMLERLSDIKRDRSQKLEPVYSAFVYGAKHVPITFTHR